MTKATQDTTYTATVTPSSPAIDRIFAAIRKAREADIRRWAENGTLKRETPR